MIYVVSLYYSKLLCSGKIAKSNILSIFIVLFFFFTAENITVQVDFTEINFHSIIGVTLVLGFTLMLLVDQLSTKYTKGVYI